jgi:hypothetical protein
MLSWVSNSGRSNDACLQLNFGAETFSRFLSIASRFIASRSLRGEAAAYRWFAVHAHGRAIYSQAKRNCSRAVMTPVLHQIHAAKQRTFFMLFSLHTIA